MLSRVSRLFPLLCAVFLALALLPSAAPVAAVGITVNTTTDELNADGDCSLREALRAANTDTAVDNCPKGSGADIITLPAGTYALTIPGRGENAGLTGDLDISSDLTLSGAGAAVTFIDAKLLDRVVHVTGGVTVHISGVTLQRGRPESSGVGGGLVGGGGIRNDTGILTVSDSIIQENEAVGFNNAGGGIYNDGTLMVITSTIRGNESFRVASPPHGNALGGGIFNGETLVITASAIVDNRARDGGGIYNGGAAGTDMTIRNSTISGNVADGGGGMRNDSEMTVENSTITANRAVVHNSGGMVAGPSAVLVNTIIAGNSAPDGPDGNSAPDGPDCSSNGIPTSRGYNLIGDTTDCTIGGDSTGNVLNVDAKLGPLQDNGGPTPTHALLAGSPARDAGNPATPGSGEDACEVTDQRGVDRPLDGNGDGIARCDIGAFEAANAEEPTVLAADAFSRTRTNTWGSADQGGDYSLFSSPQDYDVASGVGTMRLPAAVATRRAILNGVSARDIDLTFRVATDLPAAGGGSGQYASFVARRQAGGAEYRGRVRFAPNGGVYLLATYANNGEQAGETALGPEVRVAGLTYAKKIFFRLRTQVVGANPTTVRLKAWKDGTAEPTTWHYVATNSRAGLQQAGAVGLMAYASLPASNAPVTFSFDDLRVTSASP